MVSWNNLDTLASWQALEQMEKVNLSAVMTGENGAKELKHIACLWQQEWLSTTELNL